MRPASPPPGPSTAGPATGPGPPGRRSQLSAKAATVENGADPAGRRSQLSALAARVESCSTCPRLVAWRNAVALNRPPAFAGEEYWARPLAGYGDPSARLVVVGLAPAAHGGNRTGRMFTGDRSGDFLVAGFHRHGFANQPTSRSAGDGLCLLGAYMTAPVRCAPPDNRPTPVERDACVGYLAEEVDLLADARVYLALGAFAFDCLVRLPALGMAQVRPRPRFAHGMELPLPGGRLIVCTYHPSQRNVFTGLLTAAMFDAVLERCREVADEVRD